MLDLKEVRKRIIAICDENGCFCNGVKVKQPMSPQYYHADDCPLYLLTEELKRSQSYD